MAKAQVDVALRPTGERFVVSYDEPGIRELVSQLKTIGPAKIVLEASGGLELPLVAALAAAMLPVVVVNPARFVTLPKQPELWQRLTLWTRRSSPTSPPPFVPLCAL